MKTKRWCVVCGESQERKKAGEKYGKHVICLECYENWTFTADGDRVVRRSYKPVEDRETRSFLNPNTREGYPF